jgi:hypothetical protein
MDKADDAARAAAKGMDKADDAARAAAKGMDKADDLTRAGAKRIDDASDAARSARGNGGIDDLRQKLRNQPKGPKVSLEDAQARQGYAEHLQNRQMKPSSTIRPGSADDFVPAAGVKPDVSGYAEVSKRDVQMVADKYGVTIHTRPTTPVAKELLENGKALPKPEMLKNKSIGELDLHLGAKKSELGMVGHFEPKMPPKGDLSDDLYRKIAERHAQRAQEYKDQAAGLAKLKDKVRIEGNLIIDRKTGLPFTGDVDGFAIRGLNNETLPKAVVAQVEKELIQGPGHAMHGFHTEWSYGGLSRTPGAGGAQSKFDTARAIDQKIRGSHAPGGEALVTFGPQEGLRPPAPTASYWTGGTDNPLVDAIAPPVSAPPPTAVRGGWKGQAPWRGIAGAMTGGGANPAAEKPDGE